ncbi:MAG: 30S ribosomal protein S3 [Candidatus Levyibacteriota bacterium]|nr:MAG: 30S ribosomal protein S3 [Candidatus Levybacteria bacterium]
MGQKVNPLALRLGPVFDWSSHWFENKRYKEVLMQDYTIRKALLQRLKNAGVAKIVIDRSINSIKITAFVSRPGMVIGRAGTGLEDLKKFLLTVMRTFDKSKKNAPKLDIRVEPVKEPNLDAFLMATTIADQLAKRLSYKRVMLATAEKVMNAGAKGVRIILSGRIAGAEISRREKIQRGTVPLSTIREHVYFASVPSLTKKGYIGVKVWINRPEGK